MTLNKPRTRVSFWSRIAVKGSNVHISRLALVSGYDFIQLPSNCRLTTVVLSTMTRRVVDYDRFSVDTLLLKML